MIVLLDTTAILRDPLCASTAWRVLAQAVPAWDLRILVSEVVIAEAAAGYRRSVEEARVGFDRWADKHGRPLGLSKILSVAAEETRAAADSYESHLRQALQDAGAAFIAPPTVAHLDLVIRATQRRKPCDSHGNGYRDTLNWLTLVDLVANDNTVELAWVTDNTADFAAEDGMALHPDLIAELDVHDSASRVIWERSIPDLVLRLAADRAPGLHGDLAAVAGWVRDDTVRAFLVSEKLPQLVDEYVTPSECGLPLSTISARIVELGESRDLSLRVRGSVTEDEGVAEFSIVVDTAILVQLIDANELESQGLTPLASDSSWAVATVVKPVRYEGLLTFGRYNRPLDAEITRAVAESDDAGLARWRAVAARDEVRAGVSGT